MRHLPLNYLRFSLMMVAAAAAFSVRAQDDIEGLPHWLTPYEIDSYTGPGEEYAGPRGITSPPDFPNIRTAAEWEEIQALTIGWVGYNSILKQIVAAAKTECQVIILTPNTSTTQSYLTANNAGGPPMTMTNITLIQTSLNSIWMRDYGQNTVYGNEVSDLFLVDWIYNRPRPLDDVAPDVIGNHLGLNVYNTTAIPNDLMNTGGNYMSDGFGTAFASNLIIEENSGGSTGWGPNFPNHTVAQINGIMNSFMGIDTYIKMPTLPYDGIHHIDMHMKLLDEETLLVSEYPTGVSDGPQIEANLDYVLDNFTTKWGTPFKVVRIPAPPAPGTNNHPPNASYRTYANAVFVNKKVLLPTYYQQYDTTAIRIWEDALPGYTIVPIDCDNSGANIISAGGAIHCITQSVGVTDPLLISYKCIEDSYDASATYPLTAYIKHVSGIASATLFYKTTENGAYTALPMTSIGSGNYTATIPAHPNGTTIYYYVQAVANSGKVQVRPIVAPTGYKKFKITQGTEGCTNPAACNYNPAATVDDGSCVADLCACPSYCAAGATNTGFEKIGNVTFNTINNTSTGGVGYQDFSNISTAVNAGSSYNLSVTITTPDSNDQLLAWIDWNQNGTFNTNEQVMALTVATAGPHTVSVPVPADALPGNTRIRVRLHWLNTGPNNTPCGNSTYGQVEDYCVVVNSTAPVLGCTTAGACNYNPAATQNDGSCTFGTVWYQDADNDSYGGTVTQTACSQPVGYVAISGDCNDANAAINPGAAEIPCNAVDENCNGSTTEANVNGCTNAAACNYNPAATCDNGSCEFVSCAGCTNPAACNYNPAATISNGSCTFPGCTDAAACNYDPAAGCDDGSCVPCNTGCTGDLDGDSYVGFSDLVLLLAQFGCVSNCTSDLNGNGGVDFSDLSIFLTYFGVTCP